MSYDPELQAAGNVERAEQDPDLSPCHQAVIWASIGDGVLIGSCSDCHENVKRINPRTGVEEWLDSNSPWTTEDLRPVERAAAL